MARDRHFTRGPLRVPDLDPPKVFDLAVIGGGIAGAGVARDAALRGLSVVLFEKDRYGSGTSSKSSKLIHGGIRYLELAWKALKRGQLADARKNFAFVFHALGECRTLERIAPGLVKPLPILVPIYAADKRSPLAVYAGAYLYYLLALFSGGARRPKIYPSRKAALGALPALNPEGLRGAVQIWDRITDDRELVRRTVAAAAAAGARCYEQAAVENYGRHGDRHTLAVRVSGGMSTFTARKLVNASGPWIDKVRAASGAGTDALVVPVAGSHIELRRFLPISSLLQAEDDRFFFVINTGELSRVGTTERLCDDPDAVTITDGEIDYLLRSVSRYFPEMKFTRQDILRSDSAIRPLAHSPRAKNPNEISREHELIVDASGVLHLVGVKLTDHRRAAEETVDKLFPGTRSRTAKTPL